MGLIEAMRIYKKYIRQDDTHVLTLIYTLRKFGGSYARFYAFLGKWLLDTIFSLSQLFCTLFMRLKLDLVMGSQN